MLQAATSFPRLSEPPGPVQTSITSTPQEVRYAREQPDFYNAVAPHPQGAVKARPPLVPPPFRSEPEHVSVQPQSPEIPMRPAKALTVSPPGSKAGGALAAALASGVQRRNSRLEMLPPSPLVPASELEPRRAFAAGKSPEPLEMGGAAPRVRFMHHDADSE
eukprot:1476122-Rhodomonas_salina.1